jgi:hypothetical protein
VAKNSFILYQSYYEILKDLSDNQRGALLNAIFIYEIENRVIDLSPVLKMAFAFIKKDLDHNRIAYDEMVEKNRQKARKRWGYNGQECASIPKMPPHKPHEKTHEKTIDLTEKDMQKPTKNATAYRCINQSKITYNPHDQNATAFNEDANEKNNATAFSAMHNDNEDDNEKNKDKDTRLQKTVAEVKKAKAIPLHTCAFEHFNLLYKKSVGLNYSPKKEDFINLSAKVKKFTLDITMQKIDKLYALCSTGEPPLWWVKGGISDFTIGNLIANWNKIVDAESETQREDRKTIELIDKKLKERGML